MATLPVVVTKPRARPPPAIIVRAATLPHTSEERFMESLELLYPDLAPSRKVQSSIAVGDALRGHEGEVTSVKFSPDGTLLASGSMDGTVRFWRAQTNEHIVTLAAHDRSSGKWHPPVITIEFSPDGMILAAASSDGTISLWESRTGNLFGTLSGHRERVHSLSFSPDGTVLASTSSDKSIRLWDARRHFEIAKPLHLHNSKPTGVTFSPDGAHIASSSVQTAVCLSHGRTNRVVRAIGQDTSSKDHPFETKRPACKPVFSRDGTKLATVSLLFHKYVIYVWDVARGRNISEPLRGHHGEITAVRFSPDGTILASASLDHTVRLWDIASGILIGEPLARHNNWVNDIAFSPDGTKLVSVSHDRTVCIWDVQSRTVIDAPLRGHEGPVKTVDFSPDGTRIASAGGSQTHGGYEVYVWHVQPGTPVKACQHRRRTSSTGEQVQEPFDSAWWSQGKRTPRSWCYSSRPKNDSAPDGCLERFEEMRRRLAGAVASVLGTAVDIAPDALSVGVELHECQSITGLDVAAHVLLNAWNAFEHLQTNRAACLRLLDRCTDMLMAVREEIADGGNTISCELSQPLARLERSFEDVHSLFMTQMRTPFLRRYLGREAIARDIAKCDTELSDALAMFGLVMQIRPLKMHAETINALRAAGVTRPLRAERKIQAVLDDIRTSQNQQDQERDAAHLQHLLRTAVQTHDDYAMIDALEVGLDEIPEALVALRRHLEKSPSLSRRTSAGSSSTRPASPRPALLRMATIRGRGSAPSSPTISALQNLDQEFMRAAIDSLERLAADWHADAELAAHNWTLTRYELDIEQKIGEGVFSSVYKGSWQNRAVAVTVFADTMQRKLFASYTEAWRELSHPNVLELYGTSSTSGYPPWLLVSPFFKNGSLRKYLKNSGSVGWNDQLRMIRDIAEGMAYLHKHGIVHGDLKASKVLVDDNQRCVIRGFGLNRLKSEVARMTGHIDSRRGMAQRLAPELLRDSDSGIVTEQSDVYAFAMCCVEILTCGKADWALLDDDSLKQCVLDKNERPSLPAICRQEPRLVNLIEKCWDSDLASRPTFDEIKTTLEMLSPTTNSPKSIKSARTPPSPQTSKAPKSPMGSLFSKGG